MAFRLFGFEIFKDKPDPFIQPSVVLPDNDDGAATIVSGFQNIGTFADIDGIVRNEVELITRYRDMSLQPEIQKAVDQIVNEAVVSDNSGNSVKINVDKIDQPENVKKAIRNEFRNILKLLDFGNNGHEIFRRWYIDGRLFYQNIINDKTPEDGIKEIRYIDPRRIRKIREVRKEKDPSTGIDIVGNTIEYYLYNDKGIGGAQSNMGQRIAIDTVVNVNSGIMDSKRTMVLGYLQAAIKPLNSLRIAEDASVLNNLYRGTARRVFYIDVGQMPTIKAEQYLKEVANKYRNKITYNSEDGTIKSGVKFNSVIEDYFIPRREGQKASEITNLEGDPNAGDTSQMEYFKKKLYDSLNVPVSRLQPGEGFSLGRSNEISREELTFDKFIVRLRRKFSTLFDELMRVQLVLKNICTAEDWDSFQEDIFYDFLKDNNFTELKNAELLTNRAELLTLLMPFLGTFFSAEWLKKNVLMFTNDEIVEMAAQINKETLQGVYQNLTQFSGAFGPGMGTAPGAPGGIPGGNVGGAPAGTPGGGAPVGPTVAADPTAGDSAATHP